ncbi:hypothetical protein HNY73_016467 [Argiope bruennichi]|uniref:Uncharacterized protein n=1 Tax=Argiope bruennichi TaxID=94029 RepID=A0A8T0EJZ4_ARGBR|nr:hypothetical protein HNY73_016467 [Argiope bruennichi]
MALTALHTRNLPTTSLQSTSCPPKKGVASAEGVAAITDPVIAASALRAAATCGAPTVGARGWDSSRNGGSENNNQSFLTFSMTLPPPFHK